MACPTSPSLSSSISAVDGFEILDGYDGTSTCQKGGQAEYFFIGLDSPRDLKGEAVARLQAEDTARTTAIAELAAHEPMQLLSTEDGTSVALALAEQQLAAWEEELVTVESHTTCQQLQEDLDKLRRESLKMRDVADTHEAAVAETRAEMTALREQEMCMARHAQDEAAAAAEAANVVAKVVGEAEALRKQLAAVAAELHGSPAAVSREGSRHCGRWNHAARAMAPAVNGLSGLWVAEPGGEVYWIDGSTALVWGSGGRLASIVEYDGSFAALPDGQPACRGELLQSSRCAVLLWPRWGAWLRQTEAAVRDAWEAASRKLRCPAGHRLRWAAIAPAGEQKLLNPSSCISSSPAAKSKPGTRSRPRNTCSACRFPITDGEAGMWDCQCCRYSVCVACAVNGTPSSPQPHEVVPSEVHGKSVACDGCGSSCGPGTAIVVSRASRDDRRACLRCLSAFLMQG